MTFQGSFATFYTNFVLGMSRLTGGVVYVTVDCGQCDIHNKSVNCRQPRLQNCVRMIENKSSVDMN